MAWPEFITHMLATTNKIRKVAVLMLDGQPVAVTEDLQVSLQEGQAVVKCIDDPARSVTRLHLDNNFYTCFQGNKDTLIGTSPNRDCVFVALRTKDAVVVVFGRTDKHGSFQFELKKNLYAWEHRHAEQIPSRSSRTSDSGQGQIQQIIHAAEIEMSHPGGADDLEQQGMIDLDQLPDTFSHDQHAVGDDQVLLQLHD